jgi:hypothetical protein
MNHPDHISESFKKQCFGLKYLNSLMWFRDPGWKKIQIRDPGWKEVGSGIQDGNMPDPQHRLDIYQYGEDSRVHPCLCTARNGNVLKDALLL